jgi:hypothetical protein
MEVQQKPRSMAITGDQGSTETRSSVINGVQGSTETSLNGDYQRSRFSRNPIDGDYQRSRSTNPSARLSLTKPSVKVKQLVDGSIIILKGIWEGGKCERVDSIQMRPRFRGHGIELQDSIKRKTFLIGWELVAWSVILVFLVLNCVFRSGYKT